MVVNDKMKTAKRTRQTNRKQTHGRRWPLGPVGAVRPDVRQNGTRGAHQEATIESNRTATRTTSTVAEATNRSARGAQGPHTSTGEQTGGVFPQRLTPSSQMYILVTFTNVWIELFWDEDEEEEEEEE